MWKEPFRSECAQPVHRAVGDPGFPKEGGASIYYLAKIMPETSWKWKKVDSGRGVSLAPPTSPTAEYL